MTSTAQTAVLASHVSHALDLSGLATNTALSVESWALNVERSFDPAGRLANELLNSRTNELMNFSFSFSYCEWSGLLSSVSNAALTAAYASDILDRVTNITYRTAGGGLVRSFAYAYDASSLITQKVTETGDGQTVTNAYAYDGLGRLVSESFTQSGTNALTQFSYDLAGNRLSVSSESSVVNHTYTHNRLTAASDGTALAYDAAGCVTNMVRDGVTLALAWNSQRQLVSVATNGAFAESYAYDALGRRVSTTDSGGTVYHIYDGDECVADVDASGNPLRAYTWGQGIDNLLAVTVFGPGSTNTFYAVKDHLGSVHALVDASGQFAASYTYDTWGNVQSATGNGQSAVLNRFLWQGREYSWATGLYNFRARWYEPRLGRWLSNDPIGISGGLNLYAFCGNNPVNFRDPWGLREWSPAETTALLNVVRRQATQGGLGWAMNQYDGSSMNDDSLVGKLTEGRGLDFKIEFKNDTFRLSDDSCYKADSFGNFMAGFVGYFAGGGIGLIGAVIGGIKYDMEDADFTSWKGVRKFDWDADSRPDIFAGYDYAIKVWRAERASVLHH